MSRRFRFRIAVLLSVLSALVLLGLTPANAADLSDASISGKVTAPAGVDLAATQVYAYAADGHSYTGYGQLNGDGSYTVTGLPAGSYKVQFTGSNSGALDQWYSGSTSFDSATPVTLSAGQSLTGVDVVLVKGASISGKVTVPAGADVTGVGVMALATESPWQNGYGQVNADGTYTLRGRPAGSYRVQFSGNNSGAASQWYGGAATSSAATPVTLTAGQDLANINATLVRGASISGTVTAPAGVDPSRGQVNFVLPGGSWQNSVQIGSDGTYKVSGLPAGSYKVQFSGNSGGSLDQWYPGAASFETGTMLTLNEGDDLTGIDATLVKGASISGTVTAPAGTDLGSIQATVYEASGPNPNYVGSSSVNADGTYKVLGLATGSYKVQFAGMNSVVLEQWYEGASTSETATPVDVTAGEDHGGINATLVKGASISGKITAAAGVDLAGVRAYLYHSDTLSYASSVQVSPDGAYQFVGLAAGSYKIQFSTGNSGALEQWYGGAPTSTTATAIAVSSAQELTANDTVLVKGASISGKVTAPVGVQLSAVMATLYNTDKPTAYPTYAYVQADGTYKVTGLTQGNYVVLFSGYNSGALDQWYPNGTSRETATVVSLAAGQDKTGINASLVKGASISGKVTVPAGVTLNNIMVSASGAGSQFGTYASLNADGSYKIKGLAAGTYKVNFSNYNSGALDEWYNNVQTQAAATPIVLAAGQDKTAIDATLAKGATISGKVTLPSGVSPYSISVSLFKGADTSPMYSTQINSDGTYSLRGLAAGSYKLQFGGYGSGALTQWYNKATSLAMATPVTVTDGQALTAINATLDKGGVVSGKITAPAGTNLVSARVSATKTGAASEFFSAGVNVDGTYSLIGLEPGTYKLRFLGGRSGAEDLWYGGATVENATPVTVAAAQTITGADMTVVTGATISGKVTGAATSGYLLSVLDTAGNLVKNDYTDAAGSYSVVGLAAGSYKVAFNRSTGYSQEEAQYYQNQPESAGVAQAQAIPVASGQTVQDIDATLTAGGSISGTVLDKAGKPVVSALIQAYTPDGSLVTRSAITNSIGKYTLAGLTTGKYTLRVHGALSGRGDLYSGNVTTEATSTRVIVVRGSTTTHNLSYAAVVQTLTAPTPTVKGTAKVGYALTATPGTWGPTPVTLKYQWKANGVAITGATAAMFKPTAAQVGKTLTFTVTGTKTGYTTATKTSAATGTVMALNPALTAPIPRITGTAKVGYTLTSVPGTWGPAPVTLKYQWKANGIAIAGATAAAFKSTAAQVGKTLSVTVTGSKAGYNTAAKTSAITAKVAVGTLTATVPKITGTAKVGYTLTATPGAWGPAPVTLKYQWKANGVAIIGATASTYKPAAAVVGKTLTVTVTGSKAGYTSVAKTSVLTARVAVGTLAAPVPVISGAVKVGSVLTATGTWGPAPVTLKYQWKANGVAITGATAATYRPTVSDLGKTLTVTVTGSNAGYVTVAKTSALTAIVAVGTLAAPVPTVTGTPTVGAILTATPGEWGPAPVTLKYQWSADGVAITGAVASTYQPVAADAGKTLTVTVTGAKAGYATASQASAATVAVAAVAVATVAVS
ncbi:carboxypeptidase regulatory-like domain-containing protein [Arthrobacter sp. Soil736]|uniref:beta strand repeat-containing protein n=1 Tax=Arthrobacter sp. Soil736 TaxID=1736395 RepID=UPI00138F0A47|nr:carboxypeptidase regulatory-like domain-containing protein [Arthrobacter sp. Soil736]